MTHPTISLKTATSPPARERVAEFIELSDVWKALDVLTAKRGPTRAEWLAAIRSPRHIGAEGRG
jgi:hypothetical protein